jgi:hypothetical protein
MPPGSVIICPAVRGDVPRTTRTLAPGVTLTTIDRGSLSPDDYYTVNVGIPTSWEVPPSPDPDAVTAVLGARETADGVAAQLKAAGWTGRVEPVRMPRFADAGPELIGYRVRVGRFATEAEAIAVSSVNTPSDATGQRPVGDAVVVLPGRDG